MQDPYPALPLLQDRFFLGNAEKAPRVYSPAQDAIHFFRLLGPWASSEVRPTDKTTTTIRSPSDYHPPEHLPVFSGLSQGSRIGSCRFQSQPKQPPKWHQSRESRSLPPSFRRKQQSSTSISLLRASHHRLSMSPILQPSSCLMILRKRVTS